MSRTASLLFLLVTALAPAAATAAVLSGRVRGPADQPLAGATVVAASGGRTFRSSSDAAGRFRVALPDDLPFPAAVRVSAPGCEPLELVVDSLEQALEVRLQAAALFSDEVVVTAARATVGETPVTVSNIGREEIERGSWGQDLPMFLSQVPGFYAYNDNGNGIGYSYFQLRGFDMRRTAVSLNGVPLNDASSHSVFFVDLADFLATTGDIQVQRGVGTGLGGGSAIGGSVDVATRAPLVEPRARASALAGSWDTTRASVEVDSGMSDSGWAATFRWSRIDSDGYRDQSWTSMWNYYLAVERSGERSSLRCCCSAVRRTPTSPTRG